jgi:uncharacterized protein YcbX
VSNLPLQNVSLQNLTLSNISIYPIKSTSGIALSNSWVDDLGLSFDRRFVLTDSNGLFITARKKAKLCLVQASFTTEGFALTAPNMSTLHIRLRDFSSDYQSVTVWKNDINAQHCHQNYDCWFSEYLGLPCQLLFYGEQSKRLVKNSEKPVSFSDGYPLLLISQASLDDLNQRCPADIVMSRFRPNLVIEGCLPYAEDNWQKFKIGDVEFEVVNACTRCVFITIDPITGEKHPEREPLNTLKTYRKIGNDVIFGQNVIALNQGQIKRGDKVTVIA